MKKYIAPAVDVVVMNMEQSILAGSALGTHNKVVSGKGDGIGEQFSNQKGSDIWGNGSTWE